MGCGQELGQQIRTSRDVGMLRHLIIVAFVFLLYLKDHNDGSCHPSVYGSLFYPSIGAVLVFEL